jgi:Ca2+-transporting ATPase
MTINGASPRDGRGRRRSRRTESGGGTTVVNTARTGTSGPDDWHALRAGTVLHRLASTEAGLSGAEAAARLARDGPNRLPTQAPPGVLAIGLRQLKSPLIYVLLAAAVVALFIGEVSDTLFIAVVLVINSLVGGWQEWHAEQQRHGLQQMLRIGATILRDGRWLERDAAGVVVGDIVSLESGQRVPADLRLLEARDLELDESLLTGESLPVVKDAAWLGAPDEPQADRRNMAWAGSSVARGRGHGVVVATGASTVVGRLALSITAADTGTPPLVERMERFSRAIAWSVLVAATLIGIVAILVHDASIGTMFMAGVALAVSAIPEGLPVAITVALAIGARRMTSRGAIVRRLPAVEGLGSCTMIASDKTGTLTCNELTVRDLWLPDGTRAVVTGSGYAPDGRIEDVTGAPIADDDARLEQLLTIAAACNEGQLVRDGGTWAWRGDPTDVALLALARKGGVEREAFVAQHPAVAGIAFEPEHRYSASVHERGQAMWIAVKGAPERVLAMCDMDEAQRRDALAAATEMAGHGLRVLALASGCCPASTGLVGPLSGLRWAGHLGLIDPLRPEAAVAVRRCTEAGVRVIMLTGDHPVTAFAIARELGIADRVEDVVNGQDLRCNDEGQLRCSVASGRVYARVTPEQKLAIVRAAQRAGHFVAVTGDGVNDAPALRHANIGVAMGRGGTDVARDASDVVLSDDSFATIVAGIEEGRVAYRNIRNVVYLVVAAGVAEVVTVGLAVVLGLPLPLLPAQLLWLNLVTNGIQDVSLAVEKRRGDELQVAPRSPEEPLFDRLMLQRVLLGGGWMAALGLAVFVTLLESGVPVPEARNSLMLLMVLMQNVDAFNARSETVSAFRIPLRSNYFLAVGVSAALLLHVAAMNTPLLQRVLSFAPMPASSWLPLGAAAFSLLVVMEAQKASWRLRRRVKGTIT